MNRYTKTNDGRIAPRLNESSGFTLVELVVVCTIVGILLSIGVPSYRYVTTANRVSSEINGLLGDLQYARAEAIREGQRITVCPTSDGTSCLTTGTSWKTGWLIFTDLGTAGVINGTTDQVLRKQGSFTSSDTLVIDNSITYLSFNRDGFMMNAPSGVTFTLRDANSNAQYTRCLTATLVGALSTLKYGQTTAESPSTTCT
jgi:type IV fimbrial biogenesis protein FimT